MIQAAFRQESLELIPMGVYIVDRAGVVQHYNRRAAEIWGRQPVAGDPRERFTGAFRVYTVDGTHITGDHYHIARVLDDGQPRQDIEVQIERPDGQRLSILASVGPLFDEQGTVIGAINCFQDITDRRRAQQELRQGEERLRATFEQAAVGMAIVDLDGRWMRINQKLCDITGYCSDELHARTFQDITHPDDLAADLALVNDVLAGRILTYVMEKRYIRKDGSPIWVNLSVSLVRDANGNPQNFISVVEDISDRRRVETQLRESMSAGDRTAAELSGVIDSMIDAVYIIDGAGKIVRCNGPALSLLGYDRVEDLNRDTEVLDAELNVRDAVSGGALPIGERPSQMALAGQTAVRELVIRHHKSKQDVMLRCAASPVLQDGKVIAVVTVCTDITAQKQVELELREATRVAEAAGAAKDRFLAALSHELRTPLTPVLMSASVLERDSSVPSHLREEMSIIRRNVELEARLIDDLLDLTRVTRGKLELHCMAVDVHALLHEAVQTCCASDIHNKRLNLTAELNATRPHVWADPARLQQVFWNLINNAIKFTPEGGSVTVVTRDEPDGRIAIDIRDSGVGIDAAVLPRIFDAFEQGGRDVTRHFGGLGLGLAISKALVELHEGRLEASSDGLGKGATFSLSLGAIDPPQHQTDGDGEHVHGKPLRILLVEDHETTARVLARLLRDSEHHVHLAHTLSRARELASAEPLDLVISDLGLPDGSGLELMQELAEKYKVKGIALSGYGMDEDIQRSHAVGFAAHLTKPIDFRKLQAAISQVAGR